MRTNIYRAILTFALVGLSVSAQQIPSASPNFKSIAPKPQHPPAVTANLPIPAIPSSTESGSGEVFVTNLVGVVLMDSRKPFQPEGVTNMTGGIRILGLKFLPRNEVVKLITPYLKKPATTGQRGSLAEMQRKLILLCRKEDHPFVDVTMPEQLGDSGVVQLILLEGKVGKVVVEHNGQSWFSDKSTRNSIRLKPGDSITQRRLIDDINWLNWNPAFRKVDVAFMRGELGSQTDVIIKETDHFPVQVDGGFDNAGVKLVGANRVFGGLDWGNAFGLAQELNYQYMTDTDLRYLRSHSAVWDIPLPWRHKLTIFGYYADMRADFAAVGIPSGPSQTGVNNQLSMRYSVPLPRWGTFTHELSAGFDYKYANNNLDLGFGPAALIHTPTEIEQFVGAYRALFTDPWGTNNFGAQAFYSPGDFSSENTTARFGGARGDASADYYYLKFNVDRTFTLPYQCSFWVQGQAQYANVNLLPTEEFSLGGVETVRGYDERLANGDEGWVINTELRGPPLPAFSLFESKLPDTLQLIAFCDYGYTQVYKPPPLAGNELENKLASVGGGLRYNLNPFLAVRMDYGYQLIRDQALLNQAGVSSSRWQGHIWVQATF